MGFPHVLQLARLDRIRQLSAGRQEVQTLEQPCPASQPGKKNLTLQLFV